MYVRPYYTTFLLLVHHICDLHYKLRLLTFLTLSEQNENHSTQDSRVVPHRGTNWAALWLTAQIGRDAVLSESYGRGYLRGAKPHIYIDHSLFLIRTFRLQYKQ